MLAQNEIRASTVNFHFIPPFNVDRYFFCVAQEAQRRGWRQGDERIFGLVSRRALRLICLVQFFLPRKKVA